MGVVLPSEGMLQTCGYCSRPTSAICPRCYRPMCRAHAPPVAGDCCDLCEDEYRPLSLQSLGLRLGLSSIATVAGALAGLIAAQIAGSIVFFHDPIRIRVLAMAAAMLGTVVGFGLGNVAASSLLRARFLRAQPARRLPAARIVRRAETLATSPGEVS